MDSATIDDLLHLTRDLHIIAPHQDWIAADPGEADLYAVVNSSGNYPPTGITLTDADFNGNGPDITSGSTPHVFYAFYIRLPIAADTTNLRVYMSYSSARGDNAWHKVTGPSPSTYQYFLVGQVGNYVNTRVYVQKLPDALAKTQYGGQLIEDAAFPAESVRTLALENKSRLDGIGNQVEVVGAFAAVTFALIRSGYHVGLRETTDGTAIGETNFFPGEVNTVAGTFAVAVTVPTGTSPSRAQVRITANGSTTIVPGDGQEWVAYDAEGGITGRDYYYVGNSTADPIVAAQFAFTATNTQLEVYVAPITHRYSVTLEAVTLKAWQSDTAIEAPPGNAQEETAYISGGLVPIEFARLTGTRHLHFEVPAGYGIDLISINGSNAFSSFTEDTGNPGVVRYNSSALSNAGRIDLLVRVIRNVS